MDLSLGLELGTLVVAVIGVVGGLMALRQGNRQQLLELGNLYIQRYWAIDDDLLRLPKGSTEHKQARHRYLRLCEDEFEAARRGWFDESQWTAWHGWLADPATAVVITEDLEVCDPKANRFEYVRACLKSGPAHPWKTCAARAAE